MSRSRAGEVRLITNGKTTGGTVRLAVSHIAGNVGGLWFAHLVAADTAHAERLTTTDAIEDSA